METLELEWEEDFKSHERAEQKANEDFGGDVTRVLDLARSAISYGSQQNAYAGLDMLGQEHELLRVKDRFAERALGARPLILTNFSVDDDEGDRMVVEIQLWSEQVEAARKSAADVVSELRKLAAKAMSEDRALDKAERARALALQAQLEKRYAEALVAFGASGKTGSMDLPRHCIAGARAVKLVATADGGLDCLAFDWESGAMVRNFDYLGRALLPDEEVDVVDADGFDQQLAELRSVFRNRNMTRS